MKAFQSLLVLAVAVIALAAAYPAQQEEVQSSGAQPTDVVQLVSVPENLADNQQEASAVEGRSKRHLGFGGIGIGVGVIGGGFGGYPGYGYGGYPYYGGYGGFPGYGYGYRRRYGYGYGGYGYGGGFGYPGYF